MAAVASAMCSAFASLTFTTPFCLYLGQLASGCWFIAHWIISSLVAVFLPAEAIDAIKSQIKTYGLTAKDLGLLEKPSSRVGMVVPVKYRLNDDTWTGRGRKPKWLEDYLSQGGNLETLRVV